MESSAVERSGATIYHSLQLNLEASRPGKKNAAAVACSIVVHSSFCITFSKEPFLIRTQLHSYDGSAAANNIVCDWTDWSSTIDTKNLFF